jgi:hypothetical protein
MLTVFSADAAKRQQFYIQQAVRKPQRATVRQHISRMGVLNDHVIYLPTLKDSPKAVWTMKKENIPFGKAFCAGICPNDVAESVQPLPLYGSGVDACIATGPRSY